MDTNSEIRFEHLGIAGVIKREVLRVPPNQREYMWQDEHVRELYTDISDAIAEDKPNYFLGTIVLTRAEHKSFEVVDGQQRLATTMILLAAMRDELIQKGLTELAQYIEHDFLFIYQPRLRDKRPKLELNTDDNQYFQDRILSRKSDTSRTSIEAQRTEPPLQSHKNLNAAANIAAEWVRMITQGTNDPESRITDWLEYLIEKTIIIILKASKEDDAYSMFETLNDRGLQTTQTDLLKNYLFKQAGQEGLVEAQNKWSSMRRSLEPLGIENVTLSYLRHLTLATLGPIKEKITIYHRLAKDVRGKTQALKLLDKLAVYADDYAALLNPTHSKWNQYPDETRKALETIRELGVEQVRPLMLAVARHFSPKETLAAFRAMISWNVRLMIVGRLRGQRTEDIWARLAVLVTSEKSKSVNDLKTALYQDAILPTDGEFEAAFSTFTVSKNNLARYYLLALESTKRSSESYPEVAPIEDKAYVNLEHIMPETLGSEWSHVPYEQASGIWRRLGNMILVNSKQNSMIGNSGFKAKHAALKNSLILLTRKVFLDYPEDTEWSEQHVSARQAELAKLAVKTWPL